MRVLRLLAVGVCGILIVGGVLDAARQELTTIEIIDLEAERPAEWPAPDRPLIAVVNSFGFGGQNACLVAGRVDPSDADDWEP